ncbi:MAG TPA: SDR family oxidoreductase, partial [Geminicoccaceae bacterium]|nr:SDR family oxidoreductase [Geminicoccaceae bacterium]
EALAENGVELVVNARGSDALEATAAEIRARCGVPVAAVAADITTREGRAAVLAAFPEPDILVNNAGGPPPGDFRDWDEQAWIAALRANMLTPIELMKAVVDGMAGRGFGRVVNITSGAVKAPIAELGLSNGARAGLTGFVAGLARAMAGRGVTINNILPGRFDTERLRSNLAASASRRGVPLETVERAAEAAIPAGRFGRPDEFGQLCAFVCSAHAAYLTAQNVLIDGGAYPGTL